VAAPGAYDKVSDDDLAAAILAKYPFLKPPPVVIRADGTEHTFSPGFDQTQAIAIARARAVRHRRAIALGLAMVAGVFPIAGLYAFGWSVGWIRRGFSEPS
jgi:hypothetical protein